MKRNRRILTAVNNNDITYLGKEPIHNYSIVDLMVGYKMFGMEMFKTVILDSDTIGQLIMIEFNQRIPMPNGCNEDDVVLGFIEVMRGILSIHPLNERLFYQSEVWEDFGEHVIDTMNGVSTNNQFTWKAYSLMSELHRRRYGQIEWRYEDEY